MKPKINQDNYQNIPKPPDHSNPTCYFYLYTSDRQNEIGNTIPLINDETCASTPEARRLTRSMCATPKNDKNLPEATGSYKYGNGV